MMNRLIDDAGRTDTSLFIGSIRPQGLLFEGCVDLRQPSPAECPVDASCCGHHPHRHGPIHCTPTGTSASIDSCTPVFMIRASAGSVTDPHGRGPVDIAGVAVAPADQRVAQAGPQAGRPHGRDAADDEVPARWRLRSIPTSPRPGLMRSSDRRGARRQCAARSPSSHGTRRTPLTGRMVDGSVSHGLSPVPSATWSCAPRNVSANTVDCRETA